MLKPVRDAIGMMLLCKWLLAFRRVKRLRLNKKWPNKMWILGHRGARAIAPENTLSSFRLAIDFGAHGIECDIFLSRDGVPVVIHDETVNRTTNGQGAVKDLTSQELAELNATKLKPGFIKEGIPTLEETLAMLPDHAIANIELKESGNFSRVVFIEKVNEVIKNHNDRLCIIVSSFDGELLAVMRKKAPHSLISLLLSPKDIHWPWSLKYINDIIPDALHLPPSMAMWWVRRLAQKAKVRVAIWTINDPLDVKKWLDRGINGIFTDKVPEIVNALRDQLIP
jgi:glycerophosphoryl diester phosphodiesterase